MKNIYCEVFNLDSKLKEKTTNSIIKYSSLFNNCICHISNNIYLMTYRINYHGINSFITDADSLLHPMYFWEKEKYENGKLNFLPTKLTNIIKTEYSEVAKNIDNKRFLGTGIAILNYINSTFEVLETDILFKTYGYHDVRVINESISETKSRVTFYYTKNVF